MRWHGGAVLAVAPAGGLAWAAPAHAASNARYVTVHRHGSDVVLRPTHRVMRHEAGRRIIIELGES